MGSNQTLSTTPQWVNSIPTPLLIILRGIGQVFFQENALTGALFVLGIAASSPLMAVGALVGSALGMAIATLLKLDRAEINAGIYGFNAALVGIATFFFFGLSAWSIVLMVVGCAIATGLTRFMRSSIPFPTYTTPFIVTTWGVFFTGGALGLTPPTTGYGPLIPDLPAGFLIDSAAHGVSQVMFQASLWTALCFLVGIAVNDRSHATWVVIGSLAGLALAGYHVDAAERALDPERLIERTQFDNIQLGLYGYNATLVAVALFLWRRSIVPPLLGIVFSVPLTELVPRLGLPALTAPFVLAAWLVILLGWLEARLLGHAAPPTT